MSSKDYRKAVIDGLLKKYHNRCAKNINTGRRILLKPAEIYRDYAKNNAEISEKQGVNRAVSELTEMGFVTADYLKFSDDIEKIYLSEDKLDAIYEYLRIEYGVVPQSTVSKQVRNTIEKYTGAGQVVQKYCEGILEQAEDPRRLLIPERIEANLRMLAFLEKNRGNLYVREASVLVYGDSK